ncbi:2-amino-4-hydroxy-6-hydroxymethyldihydropteridinediphosphokinase [Marininema mesophilum]|uniref:2-amino-4-hydroxy-6-hydroxymethyldihydropteridine diphosphokinase n=1 Tax=Marininema mesophilum TaxID=1048340 RepID=A0A1H2X3W6_9BACL|nr:2-amino-4-hydroxy-6-hydroxymethyldihydropteridine diphosphokinase [Marininema mesophilum]SDW87164.1 2-amino-4-hydroxy-6-hydroxymethyldihydropteridinediphosphokinase [Marininema mesophilum]
MTKKTAYIGLGTNLGDRLAYLTDALHHLDNRPGLRVTGISPVYETEPWGLRDQPDFLNLCAALETIRTPEELLQDLLAVEKELHRVRKVRWGPRTIDLDLLLYGDEIIQEEGLRVPHPRMTTRSFVLAPLADLAPDVIVPGTQKSVAKWRAEQVEKGENEELVCLGHPLSWLPRDSSPMNSLDQK